LGNLSEALVAFDTSIAVSERLMEQEPDNPEWKRRLANGNERRGEILSKQKDYPLALASFDRAFDLRRQLASHDPGSGLWRYELALLYGKIGDLRVDQGDTSGALQDYWNSLQILESLGGRVNRYRADSDDVRRSKLQKGTTN